MKNRMFQKAVGLVSLMSIVCCVLPAASVAQDEKAFIKKGNEAYEKKEYSNAITNYQKLLKKARPAPQRNITWEMRCTGITRPMKPSKLMRMPCQIPFQKTAGQNLL